MLDYGRKYGGTPTTLRCVKQLEYHEKDGFVVGKNKNKGFYTPV